MARSKEYQKGEKAGREAGREEGRRECLDFLRREDAELSRKLEEWLLDRSRGELNEEQELGQEGKGEQEEMGNQESNRHQSIASRLPPEVLSMAFSHLDSHRLIMVKRVSSQWYDTIDTNASLFKVLNLPLNSFGEWGNSILEYFTRKSQNQLEQVILRMQPAVREDNIQEFVDLLSLSASHLHTLSCALELASYAPAALLFSETLLNLRSLNITFSEVRGFSHDEQTRLSTLSSSASSLEQGSSQHLRHLVINGLDLNEVGNQLTSLEIVKRRMQTVEYLRLHAAASRLDTDLLENQLSLTSVKVLEIFPRRSVAADLLSHFYCPKLRLLILHFPGLHPLTEPWPSSMEELWTAVAEGLQFDYDIDYLRFLQSCGPRLRNLRVDSGAFPFRQHLLAEILEKRFDNAEAGLEVDGQRMVFLEKLIISKKHFGKKLVARLEKVVGKVIDSKDVPDRIEIDLSESTSNEAQRDYLC